MADKDEPGTNGRKPTNDFLDRRVTPRGVLPRHLQTWVMLAVAGAMLLVILVTGHPNAPRPPSAGALPLASASALPPDRLRRYQEQLTQEEARLRHELDEAQTQAQAQAGAQAQAEAQANGREKANGHEQASSSEMSGDGSSGRGVVQSDPIAEERRRREYTSLFAESVVLSRRPASSAQLSEPSPQKPTLSSQRSAVTSQIPAPSSQQGSSPLLQGSSPQPSVSGSQVPAHSTEQPAANSQDRASRTQHPATRTEHAVASTLLEGTVIEAVLTNRLDGSFSSPANALVTTPVYALDRETVLIPAGARVLGTASPVQAFGATRLAVKFHRLVMPDGTTFDLDQFTGLNERGDAGLSDQVDRHYLQIFGASIALGSLSGLAQYATRSPANADYAFSDAFGQGMGASLATSSAHVLDRFLNVLPTVTIREGHRLKIYVTRDLDLSAEKGVQTK